MTNEIYMLSIDAIKTILIFILLCWGGSSRKEPWNVWSQRTVLGIQFLFFYHVGSKDKTQVVNFGSDCLYTLKHLAGPWMNFFFFTGFFRL